MIRKDEIKKLEGQSFWSESKQCFVKITAKGIDVNGKTVEFLPDETIDSVDKEREMLEKLVDESKTKYRLRKRKSHAFGKDIFLLGRGTDGKLMWLEAPKWDCGWYWGFGYVETYTNSNNPEKAKDIDCHRHFDGLVGTQEYYDTEKGCWRKGEYVHNIYDSPHLIETTFTSADGWKISELFKQFYLLKDMAEFTHRERPGCHLTTSPVDHGNMKEWYDHINKVMIPKITAEIMRMLTPAEEVTK